MRRACTRAGIVPRCNSSTGWGVFRAGSARDRAGNLISFSRLDGIFMCKAACRLSSQPTPEVEKHGTVQEQGCHCHRRGIRHRRSDRRRFSREGACVVLADRQKTRLHKVAAELPRDRVLARVTDVTKYRQVEALVRAAVKRFGALDVMVNNAGIARVGKVADIKLSDWET